MNKIKVMRKQNRVLFGLTTILIVTTIATTSLFSFEISDQVGKFLFYCLAVSSTFLAANSI